MSGSGIKWDIHVFDSLESTQDTLKSKNAKEGLVIQALEQTGGRGRSGNSWTSPKGNLYLSFLLTPSVERRRIGELAFVVAIAAGQAFRTLTGRAFQLKWPNDILYDGQKLAGILIETDGENVVFCGIGVNIDTPPEGAASLNQIAKTPIEIEATRDQLLKSFNDIYALWNEKGFAPIREAWLKDAYGLNQPMTARLPHEKKSGIFKGLDENGALLLDSDGHTETIHAASVHFGD